MLDRIVEPVATGEADYAKGNRLRSASDRSGMSNWRLFGNALLTALTRVASGYWRMTDPQNGYTAISTEALAEIGPRTFYSRYGFLNDVLVTLNAGEYTVVDVPMCATYGEESSGIAYRTFVPGLSWLLLRRFAWRLRVSYLDEEFHPLVLCYLVGVVAVVAGAPLAVAGLFARSGTPGDGIGLTSLGAVSLLLGMVLDARENEGTVVRRR
ncbi:MAG: hypothetical protein ABEJ28_08045 [Salinigranum sp.]